MEIFDVRRSEVYGGSIRVFAGPAGDAPGVAAGRRAARGRGDGEASTTSPRGSGLRARSRIGGARSSTTSTGGCRRARRSSASARPRRRRRSATTAGSGPDLVDYVTEINPLRIGMFLPGVHIPIVDEELLFSDPKPADAGDPLRLELRGRDRAEAPRARLHGRADSALNQATVSARPSSRPTRGRKPRACRRDVSAVHRCATPGRTSPVYVTRGSRPIASEMRSATSRIVTARPSLAL